MGAGECGAGSGIVLNWTDPTTVNACGNHVRAQLKLRYAGTGNAAFIDSCHHHCGYWNQITIEGLTCSKAVALWYAGGNAALPNGGYMDAAQPYPCASCCQPTA